MADPPPHPAVARIERAVARIEAASNARAFALDKMTRRHARLRLRIEEAIASLDALADREGQD